jgi:signal transduction histidine kinase/ligand-binding sensor domain-containing protein
MAKGGFKIACVLVAWSVRAFALDPALDVSQYAHSSWKYADGFSPGAITNIAQTADGYLWLGTEFGLVRFDGVRSVPWQPPPGQSLPGTYIRSLLAARDGTLWIGTLEGLARWKDGRLTVLHRQAGYSVNGLVEDGDGTVWAGVTSIGEGGRLCQVRGESLECHGDDGRFGSYVAALRMDRRGALWLVGSNGLWRWKPGPAKLYVLPSEPLGSVGTTSSSEDASGAILVVTRAGVFRVVHGDGAPILVVAREGGLSPARILVDRDGSLWIGTTEGGLFRKTGGHVENFNAANGLSADAIASMFEDREGSVWAATRDGLDRFREYAIPTFSAKQGLPSPNVSAVLATRERDLWIATSVALDRWRNGEKSMFRTGQALPQRSGAHGSSGAREPRGSGLPSYVSSSLLEDSRGRLWVATMHGTGYLENGRVVTIAGIPDGFIDAMSEDKSGNVWVAHRSAGLLRVSADREVVALPWEKLGHKDSASRVIADPDRGGVWLGFLLGGVSYVVGSEVKERYTSEKRLAAGRVFDLRVDREGAVWVAAEGGLSRIRNGRVATLSARNGLPCDSVDWSIEDDADATWLRTTCGILGIPKAELAGWAAAVDRGTDARPMFHGTRLDNADGVRSAGMISSFSPHVTKAWDGRLWFITVNGLAALDPRRLRHNLLPPPVAIEEVIADRITYPRAGSPIRLPPLVRDVQIDYTAMSFVAPEKVRFRYRLEGRDRDWQDAGNRRQAFYTDLEPRNYRFRVIAANNSGVWNEQGASLDFSVAPAYWQTNWFRVACVAAFLLVLWALYRLRLRQIARTFTARLEERVGERTRIARDLHDTLLQSFQGLLLRFQTVYEMLPPAPAREVLGSAIDQTAHAITEGRNAVQGLRASTVETNDLALAITSLGTELAAEWSGDKPVEMCVAVEGSPRTLQPIVRDEVYRIAAEALRNAFRHAAADEIEVELRYDARQLRLRIRDDGKGIAPQYLAIEGREGHFGLRGMRERAKLMGGRLTVWTAPASGTEIELTIPAAHAYADAGARRSWLDRLSGKSAESANP